MNSIEFEQRREEANKKLLEAIRDIDPTDPDACKNYETITKLYHELNADIKNQIELETEKEKLEVERKRIDVEAETKANAIEMEKSRTKSESKTGVLNAILDFGGKVLVAISGILGIVTSWKMYKASTEFEKDNALLTETDKTVVRNGLSGRFLNF